MLIKRKLAVSIIILLSMFCLVSCEAGQREASKKWPGPREKVKKIQKMRELKGEEHIKYCIECLRDDYYLVRIDAAGQLARTAGPEAIPALEELVENDPYFEDEKTEDWKRYLPRAKGVSKRYPVREGAAVAIYEIKLRNTKNKEEENNILHEILKHEYMFVQEIGAAYLADRGDKRAIPVLKKLLKEQELSPHEYNDIVEQLELLGNKEFKKKPVGELREY